MAINRRGRDTTGMHRKGHTTTEVWKFVDGAWRSVWQYIRSCFGRGFWVNGKNWSNKDYWKNN